MHSLLARNTNPSWTTNLFHAFPSLQCSKTSLKLASFTYYVLIVSKPKILQSSCVNKVYRLDKAPAMTFSFPFLCLMT
jgi:hypothetical protein